MFVHKWPCCIVWQPIHGCSAPQWPLCIAYLNSAQHRRYFFFLFCRFDLAVKTDDVSAVQKLLAQDSDLSSSCGPKGKLTILHLAAQYGKLPEKFITFLFFFFFWWRFSIATRSFTDHEYLIFWTDLMKYLYLTSEFFLSPVSCLFWGQNFPKYKFLAYTSEFLLDARN